MRNIKKISLIGAGNIGGTLAHLCIIKELGNVVLFDINEGTAKGKALDLSQSAVVEGVDISVTGTSDYKDIKDSDVIIVTAGVARKPGMSRDDLIDINTGVIEKVALNIKDNSPEAFVIVITNPLDTMVSVMKKVTGFKSSKVIGMAGVLDSCRFSHFLSEELNISVKEIRTMVLGGHGDTMVPLKETSNISGISLNKIIEMGLITKERLEEIIQRTRDGGAEIVGLLKKGSAYYAPAASAISMAESYLKDMKRILPCSVYLQKEYGVEDLYVGVPAVIGSSGVEKVIEIKLEGPEKEMFNNSVKTVENLTKKIN